MEDSRKRMETVILHKVSDDNVGDHYSNPSLYFSFPNPSVVGIGEEVNTENALVIVGGGGLIHPKFSLYLEAISVKPKLHSALWGIGHNFNPKMAKSGDIPEYPAWIKNFDLAGIRDYKNIDLYLPCVSCMHPAFDKQYTVTNDVVYFLHAFKSKDVLIDTHPVLRNDDMDIEKVIEFLGSAKTVVTDSYHGAYWAMLLGKAVNVVTWSTKFQDFKYKPHYLKNIIDDPNNSITVSEDFLQECRLLNRQFYEKVLKLINKET